MVARRRVRLLATLPPPPPPSSSSSSYSSLISHSPLSLSLSLSLPLVFLSPASGRSFFSWPYLNARRDGKSDGSMRRPSVCDWRKGRLSAAISPSEAIHPLHPSRRRKRSIGVMTAIGARRSGPRGRNRRRLSVACSAAPVGGAFLAGASRSIGASVYRCRSVGGAVGRSARPKSGPCSLLLQSSHCTRDTTNRRRR